MSEHREHAKGEESQSERAEQEGREPGQGPKFKRSLARSPPLPTRVVVRLHSRQIGRVGCCLCAFISAWSGSSLRSALPFGQRV